jgi:transposase
VGLAKLAAMKLSQTDKQLVQWKLQQLRQVQEMLVEVEKRMQAIYDAWPEAQWVDQVRGIGMVTAVSLLAHIGPIERFVRAEELISYAGLAPGMWQSDGTCHHGRIGGGGTDSHLRYLLIEATTWLCQIPRYRPTYERIQKKRGKKIARLAVARLLLRSLHKMLTAKVRFNPMPQPSPKTATAETTATAGCSR